jgi:fructose-1,6-bisphosphatase/inositol monophosphatase family enzyme
MAQTNPADTPQDSGPGEELVEELFEAATTAAEAAADILRGRFGTTVQDAVKSSPTDPVTLADKESEAAVTAVLKRLRPDDALIGEEGTSTEGTSSIRWVIDPLDGTVNYLYGSRDWNVSIAACDDDGPLVGVVFDVMGERRYHAVRGRGSWLDDERLTCRETPGLEQALILIGLDYSAARRREQLIEFGALATRVRDFRRHGSAALELCRVAAGQADAYVEAPIRTWDISAGVLIAQEAGAVVRVCDLGGQDRAVIAATPRIVDELVDILSEPPHGRWMFQRFAKLDAIDPAVTR